jgi:hypothetical protein
VLLQHYAFVCWNVDLLPYEALVSASVGKSEAVWQCMLSAAGTARTVRVAADVAVAVSRRFMCSGLRSCTVLCRQMWHIFGGNAHAQSG